MLGNNPAVSIPVIVNVNTELPSSDLTRLPAPVLPVANAVCKLRCGVDKWMEPPFRDNHNTVGPYVAFQDDLKLQFFRFVCDGSGVCKEDTWKQGFEWSLP